MCRFLVLVLLLGAVTASPQPDKVADVAEGPRPDKMELDATTRRVREAEMSDDFAWGTATASYQIEGAWNIEGKGENIWDMFSHAPGNVLNGDTGDVACDSYHKWREDIQLLKQLGVTHYRLSISWSRVLPRGTAEKVNPHGVEYYRKVLKALREAGIEPSVTLYHWDLPQALQERGGWLNPEIVDWFQEYADVCYKHFGEYVKNWVTINEPWCVSYLAYGPPGSKAPGLNGHPATAPYIATHNLILSHAAAYRLYHARYALEQGGKVGIVMNTGDNIPATGSHADEEASERAQEFMFGWYADPLYFGDYPESMKLLVGDRLPEFTEAQKLTIRRAVDFWGVNYYTSAVVRPQTEPVSSKYHEWGADQHVWSMQPKEWPLAGSVWLRVYPEGLRGVLKWVSKRYNNLEMMVTENGMSDLSGTTSDPDRIYYVDAHIEQVKRAILLDGCNVTGYFLWSLMDNFEWESGYAEKFGITKVDFSVEGRTRTPKDSFWYYRDIVEKKGQLPEDLPEPM